MNQENNKRSAMSSWNRESTSQIGLSSPASLKPNRLIERGNTNVRSATNKTNITSTTRKTTPSPNKDVISRDQTSQSNAMGAGGEKPVAGQQMSVPIVSKNNKQHMLGTKKTPLMKKAYVRFDDYLDLNEENMRRSCKRLMNHLYLDNSNSHSSKSTIISPPQSSQALSLRLQSQPIAAQAVPRFSPLKASKCPSVQTGAPIKSPPNSIKAEVTSNTISLLNNQVKAADRSTISHLPAAAINGKSYLRSQYERRQLRQMELMNKMQQQQHLAPSKLHIADGANIRRQHQQDLVAKSHELSKRRFFEKLERRESIKNLNLSTPTGEHQLRPTVVTSVPSTNQITTPSLSTDELQPIINSKENQEVVKQKGLGDDELILQVYQSIALEKANSDLVNKTITLDGLDGTNEAKVQVKNVDNGTEELTVELIGFYTPSPQSPAGEEQEQLIEFSTKTQEKEEEICDDRVRKEIVHIAAAVDIASVGTAIKASNLWLTERQPTSAANQSAFEIRVPAYCETNEATMRETGTEDTYARCCASPANLVVKQVEVEESGRLFQPSVRTSSSNINVIDRQPPTSNRLFELKVSRQQKLHQQVTNKMNQEKPVDDLTDNKVRLIKEGSNQICQTMESPSTGTSKISSHNTRNLTTVQEVGHQQQKPLDGISLAISAGNSRSNCASIENFDNSKSNPTYSETIQMTTSKSEMTTSTGEVKSRKLVVEKSALLGQPAQTIEVCGASNRVKDHEAPEMALLLVEQSGGADSTTINSRENICSSASSIRNQQQQQSAAQAQQVANSQTTITMKKKTAIRYERPEANSASSVEAIVSGEKSDAKVVADSEQVNEVQQQHDGLLVFDNLPGDDQDVYANASLKPENSFEKTTENNVNHEVNEVKVESEHKKTDFALESNARSNLIDSFAQQPALLTLKQRDGSFNDSVIEDDEGSSCSSSGFGASVSVTSSFDGSPTLNVTASGTNSELRCNLDEFQSESNTLAIQCHKLHCDQQYDKVRNRQRNWTLNHQSSTLINSDESSQKCDGYKELVGPDQPYPKGQVLVVENHNYSLVANHSSADLQPKQNSEDGVSGSSGIDYILERDGSQGGYANLPHKKALTVEYATVHSNVTCSDSKKKGQSIAKSDNSVSGVNLSAQSYSTTSAESGGFSTLPPAQIGSAYINNPELQNSLSDTPLPERKRASLLRKFGSLVSKAFSGSGTGTSGVQLTHSFSKIDDSPSLQPEASLMYKQKLEEKNNANGTKVDLMPENHRDLNCKLAVNEPNSAQVVGEVDLVILPTKHVNQRKTHQPRRQREQKPTHLRHDDRLSRETKKLSRKMKKNGSSSYNSTSSSLSSSSSCTDIHNEQRLEKSDSLFEELESLMSVSEQSTYYRKNGRATNSRQAMRAESVDRNHGATKTFKARIDIDCVSPGKMNNQKAKIDDCHLSESSKTNGPLSLLRLFSSNSLQSRATESTPDLVVSSSKTWHAPSHCAIDEDSGENIDSQQPSSGFWGFSSLISQSHAIGISQRDNKTTKSRQKANCKSRVPSTREPVDHDSLMYSNLQPLEAGYRLHLSSEESQQTLDKHQSLNMYRVLLRNYAKKRNHRYSHHHHHHHHRAHHSSTSIKPHTSVYRSSRCAQVCKKSCHSRSASSENSVDGSCCCTIGEKASVWGQLVKINKMDGSQVVELQRSHGKSWGFFVARGAINNIKGIFISRMHDTSTSNSLTGLLSIGDRILAIDECPIEPDYDILRVNQMISKKSKIVLKVKPFKG